MDEENLCCDQMNSVKWKLSLGVNHVCFLLLVNVEPPMKHDRTRTIFTVHPADLIKQGYCIPGFCAGYPSVCANLV